MPPPVTLYHRCPHCDQAILRCIDGCEVAVETCAYPPGSGVRVTLNGDNTTYRRDRCWGGYGRHRCTGPTAEKA